MEVTWENRGKIAQDAYCQPFGEERAFSWGQCCPQTKIWWNRVFDWCVSAEKRFIPGGEEVLVYRGFEECHDEQ